MKWKVIFDQVSPDYPSGYHTVKVDDEVELPIATIYKGIGSSETGLKRRKEVALLISKAPELLEMLSELEDCVLFPKHIQMKIKKLIKSSKEI